jgi:hypothetical protein
MEAVDMDPALAPAAPASKFCFACGRAIDARAEICPACGVRQSPPGAPAVAAIPLTRPLVGVSIPAALLAFAASLIGALAVTWVNGNDFSLLAPFDWGWAAAWAVPLAIAALLYLRREMPSTVGAGVFLGMGILQVTSVLPNFLLSDPEVGVVATSSTWVALASGVCAVVAGIVALQSRPATVAEAR